MTERFVKKEIILVTYFTVVKSLISFKTLLQKSNSEAILESFRFYKKIKSVISISSDAKKYKRFHFGNINIFEKNLLVPVLR